LIEKTVLSFADSEAQDSVLSGGKGSTLARMAAAGVPVPPGFIVTTDVFSEVFSTHMTSLADVVSNVDMLDMGALESASDIARQMILKSKLPDGVAQAIGAAYETLGQGPVSVRSSATAEDLPDASFAGQYDSYLNVKSLADVESRLLQVWASLYSSHAIAYNLKNDIAHSAIRMAVVIQRQLDPEASGVMFTRDPMTGEDRHVVNCALGLGEGVVAGTVQTDRFVLDPETGVALSSEIAVKPTMLTANAEGGVSEVAVTEARQNSPALDERELRELSALGRQLAQLLGGPQDIEFAFVDGQLQCLQARPITGAGSLDDPLDWEGSIDTQYGWTLSHMGRGPYRRLHQDAFNHYMDGQRLCFEETGSPRSRSHILQYVNGFAYVRSPEVDDEAVAALQKQHAERWHNVVERSGKNYFEAVNRSDIEDRLKVLRRKRPKNQDLLALISYMEATFEVYGYVMGHLHWCQISPGARRDWVAEHHEVTGESSQEAMVFLQQIPNMTTRLVRRLRKLARIVQGDPELARVFAEKDYDVLSAPELNERPSVREFLKGFKNLMRDYGRRTGWGFGSATDFDSPTWNMKPQLPLGHIGSYALQELDELDQLDAQALKQRQRATQRIRRRLAGDPEKLARFEAGLKDAINNIKSMEDHNHFMEQLTAGTMREAINMVGNALADRGLVDSPDDVFHLSVDELKDIESGNGPHDLRGLVHDRKNERDILSQVQPPSSLGNGPMPPNPFASQAAGPSNVGLDGDIIRGVAASRGQGTGQARLALGSELPEIKRGDILVAPNLGPQWTPIFPILGGIVMDQGAIFQHPCLIAREYRIPAVIQTRDATKVIKEGQRITVDGDSGIVDLAP